MAAGATISTTGAKVQRVYLVLQDEIMRGARPVGSLLPGEPRLAEIYGVSRVTVRGALERLSHEGLIKRRVGAGTVVCGPAVPQTDISADFATLMPQIVQMGKETQARLLTFAYIEAPNIIAEALRIDPGAMVQKAVRLRLISGQPFSHLTTHVAEDIARRYSEADLATTPLFRLIERSGVVVDHASQSISATLAGPDVAQALDVVVGAPLISLVRIVYDSSGRGIEHLSALYRPDRFRLEMTLNRIGKSDAREWAPAISNTGSGAR
ncbi:GntR family transcriptional regulator [Oceanibacterium hippocampi]|uniref:HTH-type transcriptional repressor YvoA n=1 Tax=Oceanibacterium hippocampi TaxID=745714 RepID=A0A1Y5TKF9_9PROT|nr:GntR family transcriptional regulator [Oceanibacterium hippocampi]SLN65707.1 HTH-type transcriptional repressor YvoA [Oceanibacterium hippocampi]